ncbi:helix-turn-helix transcriptional regulator [Nocardia sp. 2]|uniref:Helix-turn-helix transcriptional regulator n=1 Tax=Nocardia acididurans TaxID=2802282 RepID=A0ABS1M1R0_9NOCA|nr:helix-turn-helix domain-containing protein [Nocardia acididurans]MBL1074149.1 helix-turn-helix transcriptional regulator [Nocardia acididurans]
MRSANQPRSTGRADSSAAPAFAAMDLLGQRWMLRIVWELGAGPLGFLELRRRMGNCSSSMLSVRLQRLVEAGVLRKNPDKSYEMTTAGRELGAALASVWQWSQRWATDLERAGADGDDA